ncbi:hypothetical protein HQQ92_22725 [Shewanella sp. DC2-4]|uniref:hypothetical protein n=1 Tax=Shewanella sp. DC2-4 TaxID=2739431 RepID=UPI0015639275|nr:hypothetical protein [Shewanella sp. DC2-4]NRD34531.1 hypothetical protein [Shewanella sp. DC2-4]
MSSQAIDADLTAFSVKKPHRRYTPEFNLGMVHPIAKRLDAILKVHSWSKNRYMAKLRSAGANLIRKKNTSAPDQVKVIPPRRAAIRSEREETLNALTRAMIYRADYDPDAPYLFEVKASVPELAEMIGQIHHYQPGYDGNNGQYRHGRVAYDPVLAALEDMAAANLILLVHEFDAKAKQHKAMRVFFRPELFKSFGLTMKDTKALIARSRAWMQKKGLLANAKKQREAEVIRQTASDRIAGLDRPSLKNLLARLRREFTGSNKHTEQVMDSHRRLKQAIKDKAKQPQRSDAEREYFKLCNQLPTAWVFQAKKVIKDNYPQAQGDEYLTLLNEVLRGYT